MKIIISIFLPLTAALIGYLFSIHVDFLNVKAKVFEHDRGLDAIYKKLDTIESLIWELK